MPSDVRSQLQTTLGDSCTLDRELGSGGMSRVFLATEATLGRQIVVKVLPSETGGTVSVERFKREIAVAARLQHPHIVPLLTAGETNGLPFYTIPFVKGESLRERLVKSGELSVNETLHILRDVAAALAYAHAEGVVHRDIKPENIMLSGGVAVVTDFGVAKAMDVAATAGGSTRSGLTSLGVALGTPAYMAPEQASGDPHVDHRADIYAFGCIAYEMLAGSSPFAGRPPQQLLAAHVTETPESVLKRRPNLPPPLAALVMKCLEKRAGDRPQTADELIAALDAIGTPSGGTMPTGARMRAVTSRRALRIVVAAGALAVAALVYLAWAHSTSFKPFRPGSTTPIAVTAALEMEPALSPDGKLVAYAAQTPAGFRIFVRQISGGRPVLLTQELDGDHRWPRWSPDQSRIAFTANDAAFVVPALGGSPARLIESANGPVLTPAWSPDGKQIAYGDRGGIWVRAVDGGPARIVVRGTFLHSPSWSPRGDRLAYAEGQRLRLDNFSTSSVWTVPVVGGASQLISDSIHVNVSPTWAPDGHSILYLSNVGGSLDVYEQPVRSDGRASAAPFRITTTLNAFTITLSADGKRMAYDVVQNGTNIWMARVTSGAVAHTSSAQRITNEKERIENVALSHDGKWLAYDSNRGGNFDIYKMRLDGAESTRLTTDPANDFGPSWSPDDRRIAFHSTRQRSRDIYTVSAEGSGEVQVTSGPREDYDPAWSPSGQAIAFLGISADSIRVYVVTYGADDRWLAPRALAEISPGGVARNIAWSPHGKRIAFVSGGTIWTVPADGGPPRLVADSVAVGGEPAYVAWSNGGTALYAGVLTPARGSVLRLPVTGGAPRVVLVDDPTHRLARAFISTDDHRIFFTLGAWESDVWVMELTTSP